VRENLHGLDVAALLAGDAARPPFGDQVFDAVLLDVPCTNTGVIRRRPDVRWTFSEEKQRELSVLQLRILCGAAPLVRRGGRVVYSTCSIEPDENDDVVNAFLEKHPEFTLGTRRLLMPGDVNDGAFACVLSRQA
jgi:16S rRNA (cytosine967-C5)-methyltransferase